MDLVLPKPMFVDPPSHILDVISNKITEFCFTPNPNRNATEQERLCHSAVGEFFQQINPIMKRADEEVANVFWTDELAFQFRNKWGFLPDDAKYSKGFAEFPIIEYLKLVGDRVSNPHPMDLLPVCNDTAPTLSKSFGIQMPEELCVIPVNDTYFAEKDRLADSLATLRLCIHHPRQSDKWEFCRLSENVTINNLWDEYVNNAHERVKKYYGIAKRPTKRTLH